MEAISSVRTLLPLDLETCGSLEVCVPSVS